MELRGMLTKYTMRKLILALGILALCLQVQHQPMVWWGCSTMSDFPGAEIDIGDFSPASSHLVSGAWYPTGVASWYGIKHQGKRMSNGSRFDRKKFTAASRTLPLGTFVKVTNTNNNKSVVVIITDRGPWFRKRIIDLAEAPAQVIDCKTKGLCKVKIQLMDKK